MGLLNAYGAPVGGGRNFKLQKYLNPDLNIFEGPISVRFYSDRMVAKARCFHCSAPIDYTIHMTKSQAAAVEKDAQYKKNLFDLAGDKLQEDHQCYTRLDAGKDNLKDLFPGRR